MYNLNLAPNNKSIVYILKETDYILINIKTQFYVFFMYG